KNRVSDVSRFGPRRQTARNHRFEHLRRSNNGFPCKIRFCDKLLLRVGDLFDRDFNTEIAARDHDAIGCGENFVEMSNSVRSLDLRNNEWLRAKFCRRAPHSLDIHAAFDEGLTYRVDALFERELQTGAIMLRKGADPKINAWEIQPFARPQLAANNNGALHVVACHPFDHELHETVVEKNLVAGLHHARQLLEACRGALPVANDVVTR